MSWKKFEESNAELPEKVIEKMIEGFSDATNDLVQLGSTVKSDLSRFTTSQLDTKFQFDVVLLSNKLPDYSFKLFEFGYDVTLYPVSIYIYPSIASELVKQDTGIGPKAKCIDKDELEKIVHVIFETKIFNDTVSGLMKIARNKSTFLPF